MTQHIPILPVIINNHAGDLCSFKFYQTPNSPIVFNSADAAICTMCSEPARHGSSARQAFTRTVTPTSVIIIGQICLQKKETDTAAVFAKDASNSLI